MWKHSNTREAEKGREHVGFCNFCHSLEYIVDILLYCVQLLVFQDERAAATHTSMRKWPFSSAKFLVMCSFASGGVPAWYMSTNLFLGKHSPRYNCLPK